MVVSADLAALLAGHRVLLREVRHAAHVVHTPAQHEIGRDETEHDWHGEPCALARDAAARQSLPVRRRQEVDAGHATPRSARPSAVAKPARWRRFFANEPWPYAHLAHERATPLERAVLGAAH